MISEVSLLLVAPYIGLLIWRRMTLFAVLMNLIKLIKTVMKKANTLIVFLGGMKYWTLYVQVFSICLMGISALSCSQRVRRGRRRMGDYFMLIIYIYIYILCST